MTDLEITIRRLPSEPRQEVEDFVEFLVRKHGWKTRQFTLDFDTAHTSMRRPRSTT